MNDKLVKRLRVWALAHNSCRNDMVCEQAADRIEALEAALLAAEELAAVAAEFERRCRIGEVRSKKSRADFAAALAAYRAAVEEME